MREFGEVQRAVIGFYIMDVTSELVEEKGLSEIAGVFISGLTDGGAAKDAGIKEGDVVMAINDIKVNSVSELQGVVGRYRPNDVVSVMIKRKGKVKHFELVLRNLKGNTDIVRTENALAILGGTFEPASANSLRKLGISHGVRVSDLESGKLMK